MSKIWVTGSAGFIGSHLIEALRKRGDDVVGIDNFSRGEFNKRVYKETQYSGITHEYDVRDFKLISSLITNSPPDIIFHMAALPSHRLAMERPHDYIDIDIMGTANILEAARLCKNKPLVVFASTNKVYGKQPCPWKEDTLPQPEGPYAVSKWSAEKLCEMYYKYFDIPCVILRYHHVVGTRSNPELALAVFTEQALKGEKIEIHGKWENGKFTSCSANYTHVDDAIRATLLAADNYNGFDIFNIANKKLTSVKELAYMVMKEIGKKTKVEFVPMLSHESLIHHSDARKAEKELGFVAEIPVEKAVEEYIEWRLKQ